MRDERGGEWCADLLFLLACGLAPLSLLFWQLPRGRHPHVVGAEVAVAVAVVAALVPPHPPAPVPGAEEVAVLVRVAVVVVGVAPCHRARAVDSAPMLLGVCGGHFLGLVVF